MSNVKKARDSFHNEQSKEKELSNSLVAVKRVSAAAEGGGRLSFSAFVLVGDKEGRIGFAMGKAKDVPSAIQKAITKASKSLETISLKENRTIHHDMEASFGAAKVMLRTCQKGTGIIANRAMAALFELLGVKDVVAKSLRSSTPNNVIKATLEALRRIRSPKEIATLRRKKVSEIHSHSKRLKA